MSEVRLIDANALLELMRTYDDYQGAKEAHDLELIHRDSILFAIETAPTVDAVPVVRCRDCKWAEVDAWWTYCKLGHKEDTTNSIIYTCTHNFYCADGKRRTDEQQT